MADIHQTAVEANGIIVIDPNSKSPCNYRGFYFFNHCLITPKCHPIPGTKYELDIPKAMHLQHHTHAYQNYLSSSSRRLIAEIEKSNKNPPYERV